ncbi:MAG TPA: type I polyketide synthase, partial [Thermoanaerobaculia bacterium]
LERRQIPPSLNFSEPNPKIDFAESPFFVARELADWPAEPGRPRRAAVSSFGMGGTNSHAILEEAPEVPASGPSRRWQMVTLSARSRAALDRSAEDLAARLTGDAPPPLADACFTLATGRRLFAERRAVVCRDAAEAAAALADPSAGAVERHDEQRERPVAFLLPGQGAQAPGMGAGLYRDEAVYRDELDRCCDLFAPHLGLDLRELLHAEPGDGEAAAALRQTRLAQPALFAVEVALARLWASWGVEPAALLGHSLGELVAAHLAGVFTLPDAVEVVAARGRLMQEMPPGAMLSVPLAEAELRERLPADVVVAAVNAPRLCAVAGPTEAIDALAAELGAEGVEVRRLHTSHAFHSPMMAPAAAELRRVLDGVELSAPSRPLLSNLDGGWTSPADAVDRDGWCRRLLAPVRFAEGAATLLERADLAVVEVGPGRTLSRLVRQQPAAADRPVVASLPRPNDGADDQQAMLTALAELWAAGVPVRWSGFWSGERRRRVSLGTYPFERKRYWVEPGTSMALPWEPSTAAAGGEPAGPRPLDEWLSLPSWKLGMMPPLDLAGDGAEWLVLADRGGLGEAVAARLRDAGRPVVVVAAGAAFAETPAGFTVDPDDEGDLDRLLAALGEPAGRRRIVYLWALDGDGAEDDLARSAATRRGLLTPLALARSLARARLAEGSELAFVTAGLHAVTGSEELRPEAALTVGPCRVLPQELPGLVCRSVDVELPAAGGL